MLSCTSLYAQSQSGVLHFQPIDQIIGGTQQPIKHIGNEKTMCFELRKDKREQQSKKKKEGLTMYKYYDNYVVSVGENKSQKKKRKKKYSFIFFFTSFHSLIYSFIHTFIDSRLPKDVQPVFVS